MNASQPASVGRSRADSSAFNPGNTGTARVTSIDLLRLIAIFAVVVIHTEPFAVYGSGSVEYVAHLIIDQIARFAVPVFFILAGYFWGQKLRAGGTPHTLLVEYGGRLLSVFLFWSLIYLVLPDRATLKSLNLIGLFEVPWHRLEELFQHPTNFLLEGTATHLWFLVALLWAVAVSSLCLRMFGERGLYVVGALLYLVGLMGGSYAMTPAGTDMSLNTRDGPFFSTVFFAVGWALSRRQQGGRLQVGLALLIGGILLQGAEAILLAHYYGVSPARHDFLIGTLPFATGAVLIALSEVASRRRHALSDLGQYVLGIYAIHYALVELLPIPDVLAHTHAGQLLIPVLVFLLSAAAARLLAQVRSLRHFVR